jgi:hypothetical protein
LQHRDLAAGSERREGGVELGPVAHARRQQYRLAGRRHALEQRDVADFARRDLEGADADLLEKIDGLDAEGRR